MPNEKRKKKLKKGKKKKGKKKNNIDAYGPRTPDTEKIEELDQKKKGKKKGGLYQPTQGPSN
jgi:hypothetical protein